MISDKTNPKTLADFTPAEIETLVDKFAGTNPAPTPRTDAEIEALKNTGLPQTCAVKIPTSNGLGYFIGTDEFGKSLVEALITRAEKAEAERDALRTLWTEARAVVAQCRDANCLVSYGKAQCDAVAAANAWLDKMPTTMGCTIDDASNTEWQLQRVIAERDQLRAEVERLKRRDSFDLQAINKIVADQTANLRAQLAAAKETLDWAESLLCNAKPLNHCTQQEWDEIIHKWRDQKHAARNAQPPHSPTTPKPASS